MSKLLILATKITPPNGKPTSPSSTALKTVYVESDKITILPIDGGNGSLILANGYQFEVAGEVSELSTSLSGTDTTAQT